MLRDSTSVVVDTIPHAWLSDLRTQDAFDYADRRAPVNIMQEVMEMLRRLLGLIIDDPSTSWIVDVVLWAIIGAAVALIIWMFIRNGMLVPLSVRAQRVRGVSVDVDDIATIDFDRIIGAEIEAGRYRSAIRYLYLRTLRDLQDRELITYKRDRTNRAYVRDLSGTPLAAPFDHCVRVYERVWYGDMPTDATAFDAYRDTFESMRRMVAGGAA